MTKVTIDNPIDVLLNEAAEWIGTLEDPFGTNRGVAIDFFNYRSVTNGWIDYPQGVKGAPWCAAFVSAIGRLALGHGWPVKNTPSCQAIADWASSRNILFIAPQNVPQRGDVFLLFYQSRGKYGHTGFVSGVSGDLIDTIEGNTNEGGSREGYGVFARTRPVNEKTAFVRWVDVA